MKWRNIFILPVCHITKEKRTGLGYHHTEIFNHNGINVTRAVIFCVMLMLPSTYVDEMVLHNTCLFKKSSCGFPRYRRIFKAGHQHFSSISHFSTLKCCETTRIGPQLPIEIKGTAWLEMTAYHFRTYKKRQLCIYEQHTHALTMKGVVSPFL